MKYLCLIYDDEKVWAAMPKAESDAMLGEYYTFSDEVARTGKLLAGEALQPVETATTIRMRNGRLSTTDGPFAETREQLGGFYLIDAADLNEAIAIASKIPSVRIGSIEIRPVMSFEDGPPQ